MFHSPINVCKWNLPTCILNDVSLWSKAAHPFLMYHDLLMTTVKDSRHWACWLCSKLPARTEEGMNRWDAVTDGDWGSAGGQQWCASLSPTDIIQIHRTTHGQSKCCGMTRNEWKGCTQKLYLVLLWKCLKEQFTQILKLRLVVMFPKSPKLNKLLQKFECKKIQVSKVQFVSVLKD